MSLGASPHLARAINRGMQCIEAMRPTIGTDGMSDPEREGMEMLTWMSWQRVETLPPEVRDALPALAGRGLVELRSLRPGLAPSLVRIVTTKPGGAGV